MLGFRLEDMFQKRVYTFQGQSPQSHLGYFFHLLEECLGELFYCEAESLPAAARLQTGHKTALVHVTCKLPLAATTFQLCRCMLQQLHT